jgi:hypothetical protein
MRSLTLTSAPPSGRPSITGYAPVSPVNDLAGATRSFNITVNQTANVNWYINGTPVQSTAGVTDAMYTNTSASAGIWIVNATATNANGMVSREWIWNVTSIPSTGRPNITGYAPVSPVNDLAGATRSFNITVNQTANVNWYINGTPVQSTAGVTNSMYTNTSASAGIWIVNATATNANGMVSREWTWNVTSIPSTNAPTISYINPTPADGAILAQNNAYINTTVTNAATAFIDWNRSLAAWWRMNEVGGSTLVEDFSGNGNNGTWIGSTTSAVTTGKFGNALLFDGVNDNVMMGNKLIFKASENVTLSGWVKMNSFATQSFVISRFNPGTMFRTDYAMMVKDQNTISYVKDNTTSDEVLTDFTVSSFGIGEWHLLTMVLYNNGTVSAFFDDVSLGNKPGEHGDFTSTGLYIGWGDIDEVSKYFNGNIDEVRIHSRALSPDEIKASYNAGIYRLYNNFTNLPFGVYNYRAYVQDFSGNVNKTEMRSLTLT